MSHIKGARLLPFLIAAAVVAAGASFHCASTSPSTDHASTHGDATSDTLDVQLVRSATVLIHSRRANHETVRILVDPILADQGTQAPIDYSNGVKIPMIPLPMDKFELIRSVDAVLITHDHPDHFDREAEKILPKNTWIFCQPYDENGLRKKGFTNLHVVNDSFHWEGITISRFPASHYEGATGEPPFGESSSYFLKTNGANVFFTGDAILDARLKDSLRLTQPKTIVANTGECQFTKNNPVLSPGITMTLTAAELKEMTQLVPASTVVAVHMDTINHCPLTKRELRNYVEREHLTNHILVPDEAQVVTSVTSSLGPPK